MRKEYRTEFRFISANRADISFIAKGDSDASYKVTQKNAELTIDYENRMLRAGSVAGIQVIFDKNSINNSLSAHSRTNQNLRKFRLAEIFIYINTEKCFCSPEFYRNSTLPVSR